MTNVDAASGDATEEFDSHFRSWIRAACAEWGWALPNESYYAKARQRLPLGLCTLVARGIRRELVICSGWKFTLNGLAPGKGPYRWLSLRGWEGGPHPNWEYFVQVAEFVRLHRAAADQNLVLTFEDDLMDLALYDGERLLACVEVKERVAQLEQLVKAMRTYEGHVDLAAPDRGNDPLRKAKYLMRHRPQYFAAVALGGRLEYRVHYPPGTAFRLVSDTVPVI